jgi:hypothetical protein
MRNAGFPGRKWGSKVILEKSGAGVAGIFSKKIKVVEGAKLVEKANWLAKWRKNCLTATKYEIILPSAGKCTF